MEFYTKADEFLNTVDDKMLASAQELLGNVKEGVKQHKEQLGQSEYFLLFAGK